MKKLLAVGVVALGTFGSLTMRRTNTVVAAPQAPSRELAPLQLIQRIPVPGVTGRIDHFTAFPKRRLLIFAALGNNSMEIVNTFEGKVVQSVKELNEPQGVLYVPGFDKIFARVSTWVRNRIPTTSGGMKTQNRFLSARWAASP